MKNTCILLGLLACSIGVEAQEKVSLKNLDLSKVWQEYGTVVTEDENVRLHARSVAKIKLDGGAERFQTQVCILPTDVGVDDASLLVQPLVDGTKLLFRKKGEGKRFLGLTGADGNIGEGSVEVILKADGKEIYSSGIIRQGDAPKQIDVP